MPKHLKMKVCTDKKKTFSNKVYVSPEDFPDLNPISHLLRIRQRYLKFAFDPKVEPGTLQASKEVRNELYAKIDEIVECDLELYEPDHFPSISRMHVTLRALQPHRIVLPFQLNPLLIEKMILKKMSGLPLKVSKKFTLGIPISEEDQVEYNFKSNTLRFQAQISKIIHETDSESIFGKLTGTSKMSFSLSDHLNNNDFELEERPHDELLGKIKLDWSSKGVGGLNKEIQEIIDQVFLPRTMTPEEIKKYGIQFNNGVLLYGPPGTGKTLIAKTISEIFTNHITIINGPELKNKYVGQSEENLRNVFKDAIREWNLKGEKSHLYVYIFDEIDSLFPKRRENSNTHVEEGLTTTLLTLLDGIDSPKNFVVFGLTNRETILDPALLRPGRFSVQIKIGLPDEAGRRQILNIHTQTMKQNNLLDVAPDYLDILAKRTENWSGAELSQLIKRATDDAIKNNFEFQQNNDIRRKQETPLAKVSESHFEMAIRNIKPHHIGSLDKLNPFLKKDFFLYSEKLKTLFQEMKSHLETLDSTGHCSMAVFGPPGVGKTTVAVQIARTSGATCIEMIRAEDLEMKDDLERHRIMEESFQTAAKGRFSAIILDGLEDLLRADPKGNFFSNPLRIYLKKKFNKPIETGKKQLIIATCEKAEFFESVFGIETCSNFNATLEKITSCREVIELLEFMKIKIQSPPRKSMMVHPIAIRDLLYKLNQHLNGASVIQLSDFLSDTALFNGRNNTHTPADFYLRMDIDNPPRSEGPLALPSVPVSREAALTPTSSLFAYKP